MKGSFGVPSPIVKNEANASHRGLLLGTIGLTLVAGWAAITIHPLVPIVLVAGLWLIFAGIRSPFVLLLLFLVVLFLRPGDFFPALDRFKIARLFALGTLALTALSKLTSRELTWVRSRQNGWLITLSIAVLITSQLGTNAGESMAAFKETFIKILIVYVLIVNLVDTPRRAGALTLIIGLCTAALGSYAIWAKMTGVANIEGSRAAFVGLLGDPNDLALTLLLGVPFLLLAAGQVKNKKRLLFLGLLILTVGGIISTQSRGGILGLGAALYLIFRARFPSRLMAMGFGGLGVLVLVVVAGIGSRKTTAGAGIDTSAQGRLDAWQAGWRMFTADPLTGVGFERFPENYPLYALNAVEWTNKAAHNSWVKALGETGLLGFVPFCILLGLTGRAAWRIQQKTGPPSDDGLYTATRMALLPTFVGLLVCAFFLSQTWNWFLYILIALITAVEHIDGDAPKTPVPVG